MNVHSCGEDHSNEDCGEEEHYEILDSYETDDENYVMEVKTTAAQNKDTHRSDGSKPKRGTGEEKSDDKSQKKVVIVDGKENQKKPEYSHEKKGPVSRKNPVKHTDDLPESRKENNQNKSRTVSQRNGSKTEKYKEKENVRESMDDRVGRD